MWCSIFVMENKILQKLNQSNLLSFACYMVAKATPNFKKLIKYKNVLQSAYYINRKKTIIGNNPIVVRIAPISTCNYRCLFCEIHKDNLLFPDRPKNMLTLENIRNYESFLSSAYKLEFYGGTEEPLLNIYFGDIVKYLIWKYGIKMMVNTNASSMNTKLSNIFIEYGFDEILISYHAGTKSGYRYLMTGNIEKVDNNINYLKNKKEELNKDKPYIYFNFALQKDNATEYKAILDKAKLFNVNTVYLNEYYGGRNRLQDLGVSYEHDKEEGNRILNKIYSYAKQLNIKLLPAKPRFWRMSERNVEWNSEYYDKSKKCVLPWTNIHFNPVLSDANCHYVGVCNRIELFKINYEVFNLNSNKQFGKIWNHPLLQFLRYTINSDKINPICKYCKNYNLGSIRSLNASKYAEVRDNAVKDFFNEFERHYAYDDIEGLEVLNENPHADYRFKDKLETLESESSK